ncbi:uncharacterized protein CDAR_616301 [Caerostris darwini]|uniref:Uncharacterized protein n=1 Tax=Caerostris darwini TaxID=1538125 RepID=A0AAV4WEB2_9ARAC|nr:uncharacterized protein CDAR_616301 [Caerostris darwini]
MTANEGTKSTHYPPHVRDWKNSLGTQGQRGRFRFQRRRSRPNSGPYQTNAPGLSMKWLLVLSLLVLAVAAAEDEGESTPKESWWKGFAQRVKSVLSKWKEDIKLLWDDVLAKADDMRSWTSEVLDAFKAKMKEWVEKRTELPEDEKNEIETFISKLKTPTQAPPKIIDP